MPKKSSLMNLCISPSRPINSKVGSYKLFSTTSNPFSCPARTCLLGRVGTYACALHHICLFISIPAIHQARPEADRRQASPPVLVVDPGGFQRPGWQRFDNHIVQAVPLCRKNKSRSARKASNPLEILPGKLVWHSCSGTASLPLLLYLSAGICCILIWLFWLSTRVKVPTARSGSVQAKSVCDQVRYSNASGLV